MVKEVTLDSSVLISALVKGDEFRPVARQIMKRMFSGQYHSTTSATAFVEVCGSISRRTDTEKALSAKNQLVKWKDMNFITYTELTEKRSEEAAELAIRLKFKGMDATVVQVAKEKNAALITFDEEMAEKAKAAVEVLTYKDFGVRS